MTGHTSLLERAPLLVAVLSLAFTACRHDIYFQFDPPVVCRIPGPVIDSVFLIGDAGYPELPDPKSENPDALVDPVLTALASDVAARVEELGADRTAVVVLGDNVYPAGMPPPGAKGHERAARILEAQIAAIGEARGFFTLGNHDWDQGKKRGWAFAKAQVDYLASRAPNISVHPGQTCPGPDDIEFGDHLHLVFFDVWAAIYQIEYPDGPQSHCTPGAGEGRLARVIDGVLADTGERRAVFVAHPMSAKYRTYVEGAKALFTPGHPTLVVAGHEHSLQVHIDPDGVFHAVSGAGSVRKVDFVRDMKSDLMSLAAPGYMRLDVYADATLRLNVIALDDDGDRGRVFSTCIP
jgi:hypothetical protein